LWEVKALRVAREDSGPGLEAGQQATGSPGTGRAALLSVSVCNLRDLRRLAATNTMTAMTTVPQMAALAAMVILSM